MDTHIYIYIYIYRERERETYADAHAVAPLETLCRSRRTYAIPCRVVRFVQQTLLHPVTSWYAT